MRKGSDVIGKSVVSYDTGDRFAKVKDLIFDQDTNQLLAFLVKESGFLSSARIVPFQQVSAIGTDAIIVPSRRSVVSAKKVSGVREILKRNNILKGTQILTTVGQNLGKMVDLYFDDYTGVIEGYEVSGGLFADAYAGRSFVPACHTLKVGEDFAFVPPEVAELMEEQIGGVQAVMLAAGEKVQEATQATNEALQSATEEAKYRLQEAQQVAIATATNVVVTLTEQKAFAIGKTAQETVVTIDGSVVVAEGQIVGLVEADMAEEKGVLSQLYYATGGNAIQRAGEKLQEESQIASDRLQTTAQQASKQLQMTASKANETLDSIKRDATASVTNAIVSPTEQKAFVIGKSAEWAIAAPDGTLIVTAGQVINVEIAAAAEQWGILDELYRATGGRLADEFAQKGTGAISGYVVEQALGRRVQHIVRTREGNIVAAPGQIVTERVVDQAKTYRKEYELLESVGLSTGEAVRSAFGDRIAIAGSQMDTTTQALSEQLYRGTEQVKLEARNLWQQLRETGSILQERSLGVVEERRIRDALGRPVTRVILDNQDTVILNTGDLITHQAIDAAREVRVLDILLSSVHHQTPQISQRELRAPEPGEASLE